MNKKRRGFLWYCFYFFFLILLIGCSTNLSVRIENKLSIFTNKHRDIRSVYTPYRWSVVEELYLQGKPVKAPIDFPKIIEFPNRHKISGRWSTDEIIPGSIFYPEIWRWRNHRWRKLSDNYFIVDVDLIVGPSTPAMGVFRRQEDHTWKEFAWIISDKMIWDRKLDYSYNMYQDFKNDPEFIGYQKRLLDYTLFLIEDNKTLDSKRNRESGEIQELVSIVERLHFWGEHIEEGLFGMQTNRDDLTELAKEMREHVLLEWTKVAENYYILLIRYQEKEEDWSKIAHAYAILEYKEKEKIYHCHYISGKLRGIEK